MKTTKHRNRSKLMLAICALVLASLACNFGAPDETVPTAVPQPTDIPPTQAPAPTAEQQSNDNSQPELPAVPALTSTQRQRLASATVLIIMSDIVDGQYSPWGIGSGTIISGDGLILTNAHVAKPSARGFGQEDPDVLIIALNEREDRPPVPTFIAEVRAVDGILDLAVVQITSAMDGARVDPSTLDLPVVDIGNSDEMHLGDGINIFGFPGIGGDTITFTKGSVSGFSSEDPVGDRAWIKTDATIAGGNSGGLATNDFAQIIGVPTRGGSGSDTALTDCRVVQDTNGDGRLDNNDTCIPIGGFINALRPINLALPLIRAAQTGVAYESPYGETQTAGSTGQESIVHTAWSVEFSEDDSCPIDPVTSFPAGVTQISANFSYAGMTDGQSVASYWLLDGETIFEDHFAWEWGSSSECFVFWLYNDPDPMPEGDYTLLIYAGEGLPLVAEATTTVGGSGTPSSAGGSDGVYLEGYVTDADTGNPIEGAAVVILKPGVDIETWLNSGTEDDIYAWAQTDANGYYSFSKPLLRGVEYPALAGANSQGYLTKTGTFQFTEDDPDAVILDIELNK